MFFRSPIFVQGINHPVLIPNLRLMMIPGVHRGTRLALVMIVVRRSLGPSIADSLANRDPLTARGPEDGRGPGPTARSNHTNYQRADYQNISATSLASDDSTIQIRRHFGTNDHMIWKKLSRASLTSADSTIQIRLHLRAKDEHRTRSMDHKPRSVGHRACSMAHRTCSMVCKT